MFKRRNLAQVLQDISELGERKLVGRLVRLFALLKLCYQSFPFLSVISPQPEGVKKPGVLISYQVPGARQQNHQVAHVCAGYAGVDDVAECDKE